MFQNYEMAFKHYYAAKRDFQTDQAWPFYAGALEMAAISNYMLHQLNPNGGSRQPYPTRYMEQAITTYLSTCKMPLLATRAAIISTEALKCQKYYNDAAMQLIKMTSEDSDLRSAILLEQAAHCFINLKMARKYAFHMILAGHRFSKASQRRHALRCYDLALRVYRDRSWSLAEDHIQFTIGRQSFNLNNLRDSASAFKQLLTDQSSQTSQQMASFLKEYLYVFKQLLDGEEGGTAETELHLPFIHQNEIKVMLGYPTTRANFSPNGGGSVEEAELASAAVLFGNASAIDFSELSTDKQEIKEWNMLEEASVRAANNGKLPSNIVMGFKPQIRFMSRNTLNDAKPLAVVDEPVAFQIQTENPLKVPLILCDLALRWRFDPVKGDENEYTLLVEEETLPEFILSPGAKQSVVLKLVPRQRGALSVVGISYSLGSTSQSQIAAAVAATAGAHLAPPGSPNSASKRGYASIAIKGTQPLACRGPRLNTTKMEKTSVIYGVDKRLTLDVVQKQPCLSIKFHCSSSSRQFPAFPETLFGGQLHRCVVELKNKGAVVLRSPTVVVNHPDVVFFSEETFSLKEQVDQSVDSFQLADSDASTNKSQIQRLRLPDGALQPGESRFASAWIRGPDQPGEYSLKFVFYYEAPSEAKHAKLNYRVLYHKSLLVSRPALHLVAVASRCHSSENCNENASAVKSRMVSIDFEVHNAANFRHPASNPSPDPTVSGYESAVEFQILRARCVSRRLRLLTDVPSDSATRNKLNFGEHFLFSLAGEKTGPEEEMRETTVILGDDASDEIDVLGACPSSQFALRSKKIKDSNGKTEEENSSLPKPPEYLARVANLDNIAESRRIESVLILSWKASVLDTMGNTSIVFGQHHACLGALDELVLQKPSSSPSSGSTAETSSHLSVKPPVVFPPVNHHVRRRRSLPKAVDVLEPGCLGQLIFISLAFPSQTVHHDFNASRLCRIQVSVNVVNVTLTEVGFVLETGGVGGLGANIAIDRIGGESSTQTPSGVTSPAPITPFSWSGPMVRQRRLAPGGETRLKLVACIDRAGSFNLSAFAVRAAPTCVMEGEEGKKRDESFTDSSSLTLQKCNPVRTIIVKDHGR